MDNSTLEEDAGVMYSAFHHEKMPPELLEWALELIIVNISFIYTESGFQQNEPLKEAKKKEMTSGKSRFIVLSENCSKDLVGFVHYQFTGMADEDAPSGAYCYELQICKSHQGKGLGRYLMRLFEESVKEHYAKRRLEIPIALTVQRSNIKALEFYQKIGYSLYKRSKSFWIMRKSIHAHHWK
jgi:ribosomal protein S18 acetylase RimI-like enzyme